MGGLRGSTCIDFRSERGNAARLQVIRDIGPLSKRCKYGFYPLSTYMSQRVCSTAWLEVAPEAPPLQHHALLQKLTSSTDKNNDNNNEKNTNNDHNNNHNNKNNKNNHGDDDNHNDDGYDNGGDGVKKSRQV